MTDDPVTRFAAADRLNRVHDALLDVLAAAPALRALLQPGHPALGEPHPDGGWHMTSIAVAVAHYGNRPSLGLWIMCRSVAALEWYAAQPPAAELWQALFLLARGIDNTLVAAHGLRAALKVGHPSLGEMAEDDVWHPAPLAFGVTRYGASPLFAVWAMCRAAVALRAAWTGDPGPAVEALPDAPDEAPGLEVAAPPPADVDGDQQPRLGV